MGRVRALAVLLGLLGAVAPGIGMANGESNQLASTASASFDLCAAVPSEAAAAALGGQHGRVPCYQHKGYPQGQALFEWGPNTANGATPLFAGWALDPRHVSSGKSVPKGDTTTTVRGHYAIVARPANEGVVLYIAYGNYTLTVGGDLAVSATVQDQRVTAFARAVIAALN